MRERERERERKKEKDKRKKYLRDIRGGERDQCEIICKTWERERERERRERKKERKKEEEKNKRKKYQREIRGRERRERDRGGEERRENFEHTVYGCTYNSRYLHKNES